MRWKAILLVALFARLASGCVVVADERGGRGWHEGHEEHEEHERHEGDRR